MNEKGKVEMRALGCIGAIVLWLASVILRGWALSVLWGWFIVETFNAPTLTIVPAIGLSLVVGFLTQGKVETQSKKTGKSVWEDLFIQLFVSLLLPVVSVGIGWIIQLFM